VCKGCVRKCRLTECNLGDNTFGDEPCINDVLGNMLADAMVDYFVTSAHYQQMSTWAPAAVAILNGGSIRASIEKGTFYSLLPNFAPAYIALCYLCIAIVLISLT